MAVKGSSVMLSVHIWFLWAEMKMLKCLKQKWTLGGSADEHSCVCVCRRDWQNAQKDKEHLLRPGKNSASRGNSRVGAQMQRLLERHVPDGRYIIFFVLFDPSYLRCTAKSPLFAALTLSAHLFGSFTLLCCKKQMTFRWRATQICQKTMTQLTA